MANGFIAACHSREVEQRFLADEVPPRRRRQASGVAAMLEIRRLFDELKAERTVHFVAFFESSQEMPSTWFLRDDSIALPAPP